MTLIRLHSLYLGKAGREGIEGEDGLRRVRRALRVAERDLELSDPNSPRRLKLEAAGMSFEHHLLRADIEKEILALKQAEASLLGASGSGAKPRPQVGTSTTNPSPAASTANPAPSLKGGTLADHVDNIFRGGASGDQRSFWQRLDDWEFDADQWLKATGQEGADRFQTPLRDLPRDPRQALIDERTQILGLDKLFGPTLEGSPHFAIYKQASMAEQGYGAFVLPREAFIKGQGAKSVEDVATKLALISQTVQMERVGIQGPGAYDYRLSGSTPRNVFLQDTARQIFDADKMLTGTRMVFDVETAGFELDKGMWQLSARLMEGDTELDSINLLFRNNLQDLGAYGIDPAGKPIPFEKFYEAIRGGGGEAIEWLEPDKMPDALRKFFAMSERANIYVGQNTAFDVRHVIHAAMGKMKSSPEFTQAAEAFLKSIDEGKVVDTRLFSRAVFGEGNVLGIAPELRALDQGTPVSMANILLESSFLEDLAGDLDADLGKGKGWETIRAKLKVGLHHGDIDTWFEDHLWRMAARVLSGERSDTLINRRLTDESIRQEILREGSITAHTRLNTIDAIPKDFLARHERKWGMTVRGEATHGQMREAGIFGKWAEGLLTKEGTLRKSGNLIDSGFSSVQARAMDMGLPFAGFSSLERLIGSVVGRHTSATAPESVNAARQLMGDLLGAPMILKAKKAAIHGGKNVALPMELIMQAEQSTDILTKQPVLSTNFSGALGEKVGTLQQLRLSPFEYADGQKDMAAVFDAISSQGDVDRLTRFMQGLGPEDLKRYGLTPSDIREISKTLSIHGERLGIQAGIMGGQDNRSVAAAVNIAVETGHDVDSKIHLRGAAYGVDSVDDFFFMTPVTRDASIFVEHADEMLENARLAQDMAEKMFDPKLDPNVRRAVQYGRGDPGRANRIYSFLEKNMPQMPRRLGYAGAAIAGYYVFNKMRDRQEINETMEEQEYESHDFYERYRAEMGQQVPQGYRIRPSEHSLATAGLVGNLDREKTGHHRMGPGKYGHLF